MNFGRGLGVVVVMVVMGFWWGWGAWGAWGFGKCALIYEWGGLGGNKLSFLGKTFYFLLDFAEPISTQGKKTKQKLFNKLKKRFHI